MFLPGEGFIHSREKQSSLYLNDGGDCRRFSDIWKNCSSVRKTVVLSLPLTISTELVETQKCPLETVNVLKWQMYQLFLNTEPLSLNNFQ